MAKGGRNRETVEVALSDLHCPFHDEGVLRLVCRFLQEVRPTVLHLVGDIPDFYRISKHERDPNRVASFRDEVLQTTTVLDQLRQSSPGASIHYSEGNHEDRFQRYLWEKAPELAGLDTSNVPSLLRLAALGIYWHPLTEPYFTGKLLVKHGSLISPHSAYTARREMERAGTNVLHGHTHRLGMYYSTTIAHGTVVGIENGCLCKIDPSIHRYTKGPPNWQQGFSVITRRGPLFHVEQVPVLHLPSGKPLFMWRGQIWQ